MRTKAEKTRRADADDQAAPLAKSIKLEPVDLVEGSDDKVCKMCGKVHKKDDIFKYLSVIPEDERYKCHYCSESFSYSCLFAAHMQSCADITTGANVPPVSSGSSSSLSIPSVTTVMASTAGSGAQMLLKQQQKPKNKSDIGGYKCEVCKRIFTNRLVLTNHVERDHNGKGPTECEFCRKKYSSVVDLIMHKKTHSSAAPYQCQYCDRRFINKSQVTEHERVHTGSTPYRCEFCNRGFSYRSNLIVHKRIHDSKRNHFECDQCGETFQHGAQLTRHKLVHTTDKPLDCRYCGKRFVIYSKLLEHITQSHPAA